MTSPVHTPMSDNLEKSKEAGPKPEGPLRLNALERGGCGQDRGASFRKPQDGPENDLVRWFLAAFPVEVPRGCTMTVFKEPRLESGFPDLVLVQWREARTADWRPERLKLGAKDIRVLHALWCAGPATGHDLSASLAMETRPSLERLLDAGVACYSVGRWKTRPLKKIFAVRRIIAIEAKTEDIQGGLQQALLNTWFASASYLLTPHVPRPSGTADRATAFGVGLWSQKAGIVQRPNAAPVPRSYASWLFNEWVWRARLDCWPLSRVRNNDHRYSLAGRAVS